MQTLPPSPSTTSSATDWSALLARLDGQLAKAVPFAARNAKFDRRIQILVVEDQHFMRQTMSLLLNDPSLRLRFAGSVEEAVQAYVEMAPHMVFIDIELPGLNGLALLPLLAKHDPQAYPVMVTGDTDSARVRQAMQNGAKGYIAKPYNRQTLVECVQRYRGTI